MDGHLEAPQAQPTPSDRKTVVALIKRILRRSLYEDCDFDVTNEYISIDLRYDSKSYVEFHQGRIAKLYPARTKIEGTRVTVYFGE